MEIVEKLSTCKGKDCISFNGFKYRRPRVSKQTSLLTWYIFNKHCNGTLITNANLEVPIEREHTHLADNAKMETSIMLDNMRTRAITETTALPQIYREESVKLAARTEGVVPALPFVSIQSSLYHRSHEVYPKIPNSFKNVAIPQQLLTTPSGENFRIHQNNKQGILILGKGKSLDIMSDADGIFMDGTFYVVPTIYKQLCSFHVFESGKQVPLIFCLLKSKSTSTYVRLFRALRQWYSTFLGQVSFAVSLERVKVSTKYF